MLRKNNIQDQVLLVLVASQIMTEKWKNFSVIDGIKFSKYEVSSLGRIRNKKFRYIFSDLPNCAGYICNEFCDDEGKYKTVSAHIIVARTFLGEPESDDLTVDHVNREPTDNRVVNLRWATKKQQVVNSNRSKCKPKGQPVIQYTMDMEEIKRWSNMSAAERQLGISRSSISSVCKGKREQSGGFKWAYERQDLDGEIWKEYVPGTKFRGSVEEVTDTISLKPFNFQVSNMGRIKSPHSHIIYGAKTSDGYMKYGKSQKFVHVMVAEVFLPNPDGKPEVNHKDKDRLNNKLENLEWATRSEQMIHSHQNNSNPNRYSTAKAVNQYDLEGKYIGEYRSIGQASKQTVCSVPCISRVCSGLSESTKGFIFKYANEDVSNRTIGRYPTKVDRIDERENHIKTYESVRAASLDLEISYSCINNVLCGTTKKTKDGYRFKHSSPEL